MEAVAAKLVIGVLIALSQAFHTGLEALQNKQFDQAITELTKVIDQQVPGNVWRDLALYYRARAYYGKGDAQAALRDLTALLSSDVPADLYPEALAFFEELGGDQTTLLPVREPPAVWSAFMTACQEGKVEEAMTYCTETHRALYAIDPDRYTESWSGLATNVIGTYHVLAWRVERVGNRIVCLLALQNQTDDLYRVDMLSIGGNWQIASVERMRGYADPEINWVRLHRIYRVIEMYVDRNMEGTLPPSLESLITARLLRRQEAEWRNRKTGEQSLFAYCDTLETLEDPPAILVASPEAVDEHRLVLYTDGKVRALPEEEFIAAAREQGWRAPGLIKAGKVTDEQRSYIQGLIDQLAAADFETRDGAVRKLLEVGEPAVPYLEALQDAEDPEVRLTVRQMLDEMMP